MLADLILSLVVAVLVVALLRPARRDAPGRSTAVAAIFMLLLAFPLLWAMGTLLSPAGPVFAGFSWLGFALVLGLLLMVVTTRWRSRWRERLDGADRRDAAAGGVGREAWVGTASGLLLVLWLLLLVTALVVGAGQVLEPESLAGPASSEPLP